jgi:hypothetical protein
MSDVHYFPRYSQRENVVTNNTLLLLLRLREYSRLLFERFMEALCADEEHDITLTTSWLRFQQQISTGKSIVDGYIAQDSVKIAVETKLTETFDTAQLNSHLALFGTEQHKVLILLSPSLSDAANRQLDKIRRIGLEKNIQVIATTFEIMVAKAKGCLAPHEEEMRALIDDFEDFCSEGNLLPRDKVTIFVPPCGQSFEDNIRLRLYHCPAAWSRRKTEYLGIYTGRSVRAIGKISNVVACTVDSSARTITPLTAQSAVPLAQDEVRRILEATECAKRHGWDITQDNKFYLLDPLELTDFQKESPRGIQGHRYIDLEGVFGHGKIPKGLPELASALRGHKWQ